MQAREGEDGREEEEAREGEDGSERRRRREGDDEADPCSPLLIERARGAPLGTGATVTRGGPPPRQLARSERTDMAPGDAP